MDFDPLAVDVPRLLTALGISAQHEGDRWIARCPSPDHDDANPSWDIKDQPGTSRHSTHHCLSCKWGGTSTELVADLLNITFQGAREYILEHAMGQIPIVQSIAVQTVLSGRGFHLPAEVMVVPLTEWPESAQRYIESRNITEHQVSHWGLGYAVAGRLSGRIIIPARDGRGVLQSYTARTFIDSPKRYLEPKKIEGPHDGAIFGEQHWPPKEERNIVVVTEGALNALAVERVAKLSIASLFGTSVSLHALSKLSSFQHGLLLTDPDMAGDRAAEKIQNAFARHVKLSRVQLPKGTDANSVDPHVLRQALEEAWFAFRRHEA